MSDRPDPQTLVWADQVGARLRDIGKVLIKASAEAAVDSIAAEIEVEIIEGEGLATCRIAYDATNDQLWLLPMAEPEAAFPLDHARLGIDRKDFEVEYVPASQLQGAVEEREAMYEALVDQFGSHKLAEIAYQRKLAAKRGQ